MKGFPVSVDVADKFTDAAAVVKNGFAFLLFGRRSSRTIRMPLFRKASSRSRFSRDSYLKITSSKMVGSGLKGHTGAGFLCFLHTADFSQGQPSGISLSKPVSVTVHFHIQFFRQGIDDRDTNPMEPAGNFVSVAAKFSTGMKDGQYCFQRGFTRLAVNLDGNSPAIVRYQLLHYRHNGDCYFCAVTCQGFINAVVNHFVHQM
jgi:hypothetical protein